MRVDRGLDGGSSRCGAAFRWRGRRLRVHWRHEQLSIRMAVESALHHSSQQPHLVHACTQTTTFTDAATCAATSASAPQIEHVAPVLSDFLEPPVPTAVYATPAPVIEDVISADSNTTPATVTEYVTPTPVIELNCVSPFQPFPPLFVAADTALTAVEVSVPQVDGLRLLLDSRIQKQSVEDVKVRRVRFQEQSVDLPDPPIVEEIVDVVQQQTSEHSVVSAAQMVAC